MVIILPGRIFNAMAMFQQLPMEELAQGLDSENCLAPKNANEGLQTIPPAAPSRPQRRK